MKTSNKHAVIMAGGTGGHVFPALAVAQLLAEQGYEIIWLGTEKGIENNVVPKAGFKLIRLPVKGIRGNGVKRKLVTPFFLLYSLIKCLKLMISFKPQFVLGFGSYASVTGGLSAWLLRKPLYIHEQNAVAGMVNKLLARFAKKVFVAFPDAFKGEYQNKISVVGNPIRKDIANVFSPYKYDEIKTRKLRVLVYGGSLGALFINQTIPKAMMLLPHNLRPELKHQTGERSFNETQKIYQQSGLKADTLPFIVDIASMYKWADIVICRAGALTVSEISTSGLPAIFIPLPSAVDDHQTKNAKYLVDNGAAILAPQKETSPQHLAELLQHLIETPESLSIMSEKSYGLREVDAAEKIVAAII